MFRLKIEAYDYLIYFLSQSEFKEALSIKEAIENIKLAIENHEPDIFKVLQFIDKILSKEEFSEEFRNKLSAIHQKVSSTDFTISSSIEKFENPLRRHLDSAVAINLLTNPTIHMMRSVNAISECIIPILENHQNFNASSKRVIKKFLHALMHLRGENDYQAAISLGSFAERPSLDQVLTILKEGRPENLAMIMHIHFKFALLASRRLPLNTTIQREPLGKFKEIVEKYEPEGYKKYFEKLADNSVGYIYKSYLADEVIYASSLYTADKYKGRQGELNYSVKTNRLGLMLSHQNQFEEAFPEMPLSWVADVKAQVPNLNSQVTRDMIENESIYVAGPSGMTALLLHLMENMGNFESIEEKQSYLAAICAYIVGGGFHSFYEILGPASFCLDLIPGYTVSVPDVKSHTIGVAPKFGLFYNALSQFDEEFLLLRNQAWEQHIAFINKLYNVAKQEKKVYKQFIVDIRENLSRLNSSMPTGSSQAILEKFTEKVENHISNFNNYSLAEKTKKLKDFQNNCIDELITTHHKLKYDDNWTPFFLNLLLAFTGVGLFASVLSFTVKAVTGSYAFFDTKKDYVAKNDLDDTFHLIRNFNYTDYKGKLFKKKKENLDPEKVDALTTNNWKSITEK